METVQKNYEFGAGKPRYILIDPHDEYTYVANFAIRQWSEKLNRFQFLDILTQTTWSPRITDDNVLEFGPHDADLQGEWQSLADSFGAEMIPVRTLNGQWEEKQ